MKKIGINIIIGSIISIVLIVISLLVIKPNFTYFVTFNDKIYASQDASTFNCENNVISFLKQDKKLTIEVKVEKDKVFYEDKVVYMLETGYTAFAIEEAGKTFDATITFDSNYSASIKANSKELSYDEMMICYTYSNLLNAKINDVGMQKVDKDKINVVSQKIICVILSIFIGFILSFLAYPVILYEKCKENKKLAVICISLTVILCLSSGFYIFFTLK